MLQSASQPIGGLDWPSWLLIGYMAKIWRQCACRYGLVVTGFMLDSHWLRLVVRWLLIGWKWYKARFSVFLVVSGCQLIGREWLSTRRLKVDASMVDLGCKGLPVYSISQGPRTAVLVYLRKVHVGNKVSILWPIVNHPLLGFHGIAASWWWWFRDMSVLMGWDFWRCSEPIMTQSSIK